MAPRVQRVRITGEETQVFFLAVYPQVDSLALCKREFCVSPKVF